MRGRYWGCGIRVGPGIGVKVGTKYKLLNKILILIIINVMNRPLSVYIVRTRALA